jgi:tetratricopeptide (TPR) repeat protein
VAVTLCALLSAVGALTVGRAALAHHYRTQAEERVTSDPGGAIRKADESLGLNDESPDTYYVKSAAYARLGDFRRSLATLREAAEREPSNYVTYALMGDLATRRGDYVLSRESYLGAWERNPRDQILRDLAGGALELQLEQEAKAAAARQRQ